MHIMDDVATKIKENGIHDQAKQYITQTSKRPGDPLEYLEPSYLDRESAGMTEDDIGVVMAANSSQFSRPASQHHLLPKLPQP